MAAPAAPTLSELVAEGLAMAGESNPDSTLTSRAENKWMEEIKNDIFHRAKKLRSLYCTTYGVIPKAQSRFSYPSDYSSDLSLTLLDGNETGTAQAGSSSSITLAATADLSEGLIQGLRILVTGSTGQGSLSQITAYNNTTKVVTVSPDFTTAPAVSSTYLIIDTEQPLGQRPIYQYKDFQMESLSRPDYFFPLGDEDFGEFVLSSPPDKQYGARLRYYANIMKLDLAGTTISTLYQRWRNIWIQGIVYRRFRDADDTRSNDEFLRYQRELNNLIMRETYGSDLSELTDVVKDYV